MSVAPPGVASRGIRKSTRQSPKNMENQMIVPTVTTWGHGCEYIWSSFQQMGRWSRLQKSVFRKLRPRAVKVLFLAHKRCVTFRTFASLQKKDYVTIMYVIQTWIHTRRPQVPKVTYWFTSFTMIHNGWFYTICGPWHQDRLKNKAIIYHMPWLYPLIWIIYPKKYTHHWKKSQNWLKGRSTRPLYFIAKPQFPHLSSSQW